MPLQHSGPVHVQNEIKHSVRIPPLVVVPVHDLHRFADNFGRLTVDNRGAAVALEIDGDKRQVARDTVGGGTLTARPSNFTGPTPMYSLKWI